jgi:hypothetical protein
VVSFEPRHAAQHPPARRLGAARDAAHALARPHRHVAVSCSSGQERAGQPLHAAHSYVDRPRVSRQAKKIAAAGGVAAVVARGEAAEAAGPPRCPTRVAPRAHEGLHFGRVGAEKLAAVVELEPIALHARRVGVRQRRPRCSVHTPVGRTTT